VQINPEMQVTVASGSPVGPVKEVKGFQPSASGRSACSKLEAKARGTTFREVSLVESRRGAD